MQKLKTFVLSFVALFALATPAVLPATAMAAEVNIGNGLCEGAQLQVGSDGDCANDGEAQDKVNSVISTVINIFSLVVGVVSVIMIIIGGLRYITSGGDSGKVSGAKNTILYAIIGLVIVALAQFIVRFVLSKLGD